MFINLKIIISVKFKRGSPGAKTSLLLDSDDSYLELEKIVKIIIILIEIRYQHTVFSSCSVFESIIFFVVNFSSFFFSSCSNFAS